MFDLNRYTGNDFHLKVILFDNNTSVINIFIVFNLYIFCFNYIV